MTNTYATERKRRRRRNWIFLLGRND